MASSLAFCDDFRLDVTQITHGPQHHFFGYIGHVGNVPWNSTGDYILALRTSLQGRMPNGDDPAEVVLLDTRQNYRPRVVDRCRAWNPQQGTMFYWNPEAPATQFFFNDRDPQTGKVFCVLYDLSLGANGGRLREYRDEQHPVGNSGVSQTGGTFLALNYGRMARLRRVTGYDGAFDWTVGTPFPADDGIFRIHIATGQKTLLVSFAQLEADLRRTSRGQPITSLFINHTLWNREGDRIFFFARGGWNGESPQINRPFLIRPDGSGLTPLRLHLGGHPEWDFGSRLIGRLGRRQVLFDVEHQQVIGQLGTPEIFPNPEGDVALSPDGRWFANGFKSTSERQNYVVVYRREDGSAVRSPGFQIGEWTSGDLRQDPSPCWNRDGTQLLVPGLDKAQSRQLFVVHIRPTPPATQSR